MGTEKITESLSRGKVQRVNQYKYAGLHINEEGTLKLHIEKLNGASHSICRELMSMASPKEVGVEYIRVRLKLFEKCYMESLLHGLHAWHISTKEVKEIEKIQSKYLKMLLELPSSTPTAALYLETGIWPVTERIEYLTSMLYQNMSKRNEIAPLVIQHQQISPTKNSIPERMKQIVKCTTKRLEDIKGMHKSDWKKVIKRGLRKKINKRLKQETKGKTKSRFVTGSSFRRKEYLNKEDGHLAKEILRIRLNMFPTSSNFKTGNENLLCPHCESNKDTTEHIVHCYTNVKIAALKSEDSPEWAEIVKGFMEYKKEKDKRDAKDREKED